MKALSLVLVLALAAPAWADPPPTAKDAPVKVAQGQLVPFAGVLDSPEGYTALVRAERSCAAERDVLKRGPPVGLVVLVAALGIVVGGAVGAGVTYAATRPRP